MGDGTRPLLVELSKAGKCAASLASRALVRLVTGRRHFQSARFSNLGSERDLRRCVRQRAKHLERRSPSGSS